MSQTKPDLTNSAALDSRTRPTREELRFSTQDLSEAGEDRDVFHVITRDHLLIKSILNSLWERSSRALSGDGEQSCQTLVQSLATEIHLHAKSEEAVVYQSGKREGQALRDWAREGEIEHRWIEDALFKLRTQRPGPDGEFRSSLRALRDLIERHTHEEETQLFDELRASFGEETLLLMGERMEEAKQRLSLDLSEENARWVIPSETVGH